LTHFPDVAFLDSNNPAMRGVNRGGRFRPLWCSAGAACEYIGGACGGDGDEQPDKKWCDSALPDGCDDFGWRAGGREDCCVRGDLDDGGRPCRHALQQGGTQAFAATQRLLEDRRILCVQSVCGWRVEGAAGVHLRRSFESYTSYPIPPDGSAAGNGKLEIEANVWTFPWQTKDGGKTTWFRVVNVWVKPDRIEFARSFRSTM